MRGDLQRMAFRAFCISKKFSCFRRFLTSGAQEESNTTMEEMPKSELPSQHSALPESQKYGDPFYEESDGFHFLFYTVEGARGAVKASIAAVSTRCNNG